MRLRSLMALAAMCLAAIAATPSPASAALPHCNTSINLRFPIEPGGGGSIDVDVPAYGSNVDCVLGVGRANSGVGDLQVTLKYCYNQNIAIDSIFGPATRTALMNVQTWEKYVNGEPIAVDGVYGPQTRKAIEWQVWVLDGESGYYYPTCADLATKPF